MTHQRLAHSVGHKGLAWLLVLAIGLMGLTITRQQAFGSLHSHSDHPLSTTSVISASVSILVDNWRYRWQQQQLFGHGQLPTGNATVASLWSPQSLNHADTTRLHDPHSHSHDSLERHHHAANDVSVIALDGAAALTDAADGSASGAPTLLPGIGIASADLAWSAKAVQNGPWPIWRFAAFVSRTVPTPLRPPSL